MNERELRVLHRIIDGLRAIQQDIHAIYQKRRATEDQDHPPTQVDIQSEIRLPPAVNNYYESENTEGPKDRRRDRVRLWLEGIALGAAVLAAIFTYRTLHQVTRQADAAQKQLEATIKATELDERAWLTIMPTGASELTPNLPIYAPYAITDLGKTPAIHVSGFIFVHLLPRTKVPDFTVMPDETDPNRAPNWHATIVVHIIFPSREPVVAQQKLIAFDPSVVQPKDHTVFIPVIATPDLITDLRDPKPTGKHWIAVYGRISYDDISRKPHWIAFCWDALKTNYASADVTKQCANRNSGDE